LAPYGALADAYDIVHARKPYGREAAQVRALVREHARRPCRTLLDVACGSGGHLAYLRRWYACTGVDASQEMLRLARRRLSRVRLVRGRMETFDLGRRYDVVTCLFSAIGYVRTVPELRRTLRNFARHTAPGGVLVVEPWLSPSGFRPERRDRIDHLEASSGATTVLRMNTVARRRNLSVMDFHYLVGRPGAIVHAVERHELGLFSRPTMEAALRSAGFRTWYDPVGLSTGRGLFVGVLRDAPDRGGRAVVPVRGRLGAPRAAFPRPA